MKYISVIALIIGAFNAKAQEFNKSVNKDSLLNASIRDLPADLKADLLKQYQAESESGKEFLLFMVSMPRSSKKLMIRNIDSNYSNIVHLKDTYAKLVPRHYQVSIEFNPANHSFNMPESIDLRITKDENKETTVSQDWRLAYDSPKLKEMLQTIGWSDETLKTIKVLLKNAKCVSIENGKVTEIGFARSGMGKYFYRIFDHNLSAAEAKQNSDSCMFIFYKKNIVLEYGSGATGSLCFPDDEK
ncbi:MAG TPA: hypothetical protein VFE53_13575 [Mucilaginibacter sp.]|jgi:hypothetical protein|nr:hypothetical protein [Mucilaginibacter sp.]